MCVMYTVHMYTFVQVYIINKTSSKNLFTSGVGHGIQYFLHTFWKVKSLTLINFTDLLANTIVLTASMSSSSIPALSNSCSWDKLQDGISFCVVSYSLLTSDSIISTALTVLSSFIAFSISRLQSTLQ